MWRSAHGSALKNGAAMESTTVRADLAGMGALAEADAAAARVARQAKQEQVRAWLQRKDAEMARRRQAEAEQLRQEEEKRMAEEMQRRKDAVDSFLKANKFKGVGTAKRSMLRTTYPLHLAVEKGDVQLVEDLIREGADALQKNYSKTPLQLAQKKDKKGSHAAVIAKIQELTA